MDPSKVTVQVDGVTVQTNDKLVTGAFNKPAGVVSTMEDPEVAPASLFLRSSWRAHVGRLDVETGLLLLITTVIWRTASPTLLRVPKTPGAGSGPMGQRRAAMKKGNRLEDGVSPLTGSKLVVHPAAYSLGDHHSGRTASYAPLRRRRYPSSIGPRSNGPDRIAMQGYRP